MIIRAVIFVPSDAREPHTTSCAHHCQAKGYDIVGVVAGDWGAVLDMFRDGEATVAVVADPAHIDPDWEPRVELAGRGPMVVANDRVPAARSRTYRPRRVR